MDEDLLSEVLVECKGIMVQMDADLAAITKSGSTPALLKQVLRGAVSIKGSSGFLELKRLESMTIALEKICEALINEKIKISDNLKNLIVQVVGVIKNILSELESKKREPEGDDTALINKITAVLDGKPIQEEAPKEEVVKKEIVKEEVVKKEIVKEEVVKKEVVKEEVKKVAEEEKEVVGYAAINTKTEWIDPTPANCVVIDILNLSADEINKAISKALRDI